MLLDQEDRERGEPSLAEHSSPPSAASAVEEPSRADAGQETVRAPRSERRPRQSPAGKVVELPKQDDDQRSERDSDIGGKRHSGLLRRHPFAVAGGTLLFLFVVAAGYLYWDNARYFESSDDAYIASRQFGIAPQVSGSITAVPVTDNQHIAAGAVIARIDDRAYRIALDQAKAQLAHDQAVVAQAQKNLARFQLLARTNSIARQQVDDQGFLVEQDKATVALDQTNVQNAELNLSHTIVTADQPGRVVNLGAAVGQYAQAGTTLTNFVPDRTWVTANFKETQLDAMRSGEPVTLTIDAYPDRIIRGHLASIQPGSGTAFSLLPPENATGNWVKIVQRVPVKIIMDNPPTDVALGPGMSVEVNVRVNPSRSLYERLRARL